MIHAEPSLGLLDSSIGDVSYGSLEYRSISPYQVVAAGSYQAQFGTVEGNLVVRAGNFYTVAVIGSEALLLEDPVNGTLTMTLVVLYNLSSLDTADMKTADGSTTVVSDVARDTVNSILVNPIEVDLAAYTGHDTIDTFTGLSLKPGATYSMVIVGHPDNLNVAWTASTVVR